MITDKILYILEWVPIFYFFCLLSNTSIFVSMSFTIDPIHFSEFYDCVTVHVYMLKSWCIFCTRKIGRTFVICIDKILLSFYFVGDFSNLLPDGNQK